MNINKNTIKKKKTIRKLSKTKIEKRLNDLVFIIVLISFGLVRLAGGEDVAITELGKNFFKWYTIYESSKEQSAK